MRFAVKRTTLFIFLVLIISTFAGCSSKSTTQTENNGSLPKSEYPAAPVALMQGELTKLDGTKFKLEDYKGKIILVNLWATWCGPCVKEMPDFDKMYQSNKEKGFEVIGINADDEETVDVVKNFGDKLGITYQLVKSERKLSYEFIKISKLDAIPQTFLIDREGKLVGVFVGGGKNIDKIKDGVDKLMNS